MSLPHDPAGTGPRQVTLYEAAVPVLAFGGAALGILAWMAGLATDLRLTAAGCVAASVLLAYLAWIRPRKDIVALTTPIYAIIFFAVPLDDPTATIVLELLYAVSLTILLVRLKYRFGAPAAARAEGTLPDPLLAYARKVQPACAGLPPAAAHRAATAFLRYSAGDYGDVGPEAEEGILALDRSGCAPAFATAFAIVREQAAVTEKSRPRPEWYRQFESTDGPLLARPLASAKKAGADGYDGGYDAALDNALLLLFAGAWNGSPEDRDFLMASAPFAARIIGE